MKRKTLHYNLETFSDSGKSLKKSVRGEGWYIDDPEAKQTGLCVVLPSPKKGTHQTLYIPADDLRDFVKSMPK